MPKVPVKVVGWDKIVELSKTLSEKVKEDGYTPDVIVAVARGGLVPSRLLADHLGVIDIVSVKVEHWVVTASRNPEARVKYPFKLDLRGASVMIVDDICDTGDSIMLSADFVRENFNVREVRTATLQYLANSSKFKPDFYAEEVREWSWFMYPWNYWEDEINLVKKIIDEVGLQEPEELTKLFRENYGVLPPVPIKEIIGEMRRRGVI
ncbi:phosphoribosyltransferase [Sulfodiicoccus acidiphilus]|uniref:phosphoribosyltransferase n=1 Tax=Sulfodiicoccus acidiphilus TaxID=1670455 RepID=UPI000F840C4D|nr:phosphoribosyltransferase [Sulfodiicoccus acidiphilus]